MLRLILLLLMLLNLGYFAWGQGYLLPYGWGPAQQREPQRLAQQVHPEAIKVLAPRAVTPAAAPRIAASAPVAPLAPATTVCLLSNAIDADQVQAIEPVLAAQLAQGDWTFDEQAPPAHWILYMGRFGGPAEQAAKRAQLAELKIKFEAIDVPGLSPGFKLGSFSSQADAEAALQALNKRGVRTAKMTQIRPVPSSFRLRLPAIDPKRPALQHIQEAAPDLVLLPCS